MIYVYAYTRVFMRLPLLCSYVLLISLCNLVFNSRSTRCFKICPPPITFFYAFTDGKVIMPAIRKHDIKAGCIVFRSLVNINVI